MKIWKYVLAYDAVISSIALPEGARILAFGMQETPVFWAEVDPEATASVSRTFRIVATGQEIPSGFEWRATVQDGRFVWHIYEQI